MNELEHYQRSNILQIKGVPEAGDVYDVVRRIGNLLDQPILDSDIDVCHLQIIREKYNCSLRTASRKRQTLAEGQKAEDDNKRPRQTTCKRAKST